MKKGLLACMAVAITILGGSFLSHAVAKEVNIGVIMPLSGPVTSYAEAPRHTLELFFEKVNSEGGIKSLGGDRIKLIWADDMGNPEKGMREAERLITVEKVPVILGALTSGSTLAIARVCEKYKVPLVVLIAFSEEITSQGFKYVFRSHVTTTPYVETLVDFVKKYISPQKIAMIYEDSTYGTTNAKVTEQVLQNKIPNAQIVAKESYDRNTTNLRPVILKMRELRPDIMMVSSYLNDSVLLMRQMFELNADLKNIVGYGGGYIDPKFVQTLKELGIGILSGCYYNYDSQTPISKWFTQKYFEKYSTYPTGDCGAGFQNAQTLVAALEKAGSTDREVLWKTLRNLEVSEGMLLYPVKFNDRGDNINARAYVVQVQKDSKGNIGWVTVFPDEYATSKPIVPLQTFQEKTKK